MEFYVENNEHNISLVRKEGVAGNYKLNCNSIGMSGFIVICADKRQDLILNNNPKLKEQLQSHADQLSVMKFYKNESISISFITFAELMRNGGFNINNKPGFYTVYGCDVVNGAIVAVYYHETQERVVNISIDIELTQENAYTEVKKLFKTEKQYSGYKKITLAKGIPSLTESCVSYLTADRQHTIAVPLSVIKNGGSFYVMSRKEDDICFVKNNNNINVLVSSKK